MVGIEYAVPHYLLLTVHLEREDWPREKLLVSKLQSTFHLNPVHCLTILSGVLQE